MDGLHCRHVGVQNKRKFENVVLFSNDTGILGKRNSEFSQQESFRLLVGAKAIKLGFVRIVCIKIEVNSQRRKI